MRKKSFRIETILKYQDCSFNLLFIKVTFNSKNWKENFANLSNKNITVQDLVFSKIFHFILVLKQK
jgi:hypothetical protein